MNQTLNAEVVIVDDGSSDETPKVAASYPSAHYVRQRNLGAHAAINRGFELSDSEFVAVLNDDDLFEPWHLESSIELLQRTQGDILLCRPQPFGAGPLLQQATAHQAVADRILARYGPTLSLLFVNWFVGTSGMVVRRRAWRELGGFREYRLAHDLDFALRALAHSDVKVDASLERSWLYRCHSRNTVTSINSTLAGEELTRILAPHVAIIGALQLQNQVERAWGISLFHGDTRDSFNGRGRR
jgi:glycosyltransferase involved in cell wall biosynthesis